MENYSILLGMLCIPLVSALGRVRQDNYCEFGARVVYIMKVSLVYIARPYLKMDKHPKNYSALKKEIEVRIRESKDIPCSLIGGTI